MTGLTPPLARAEARRVRATACVNDQDQARLGQFLTPPEIATFLASLFDLPQGPVRLLDPGAGVGSLTAAVVERFHEEGAGPVAVTAVELDDRLHDPLAATLEDCAAHAGATGEIVAGDFIEWGVERGTGFGQVWGDPFDLVVMNPPYRKIANASAERRLLAAAGIEVSNLYAAFLALAVRLLGPNGQLVAITPRSFANGPYFRQFRRDFLNQMALRRVHVIDTRDVAFADAEVLQENVVFHAVKDGPRDRVLITSSAGTGDELIVAREVPYEQVIDPADRDAFIHLSGDEVAAEVARRIRALPARLHDLGCAVSTGRVVDFRVRRHLRAVPGHDTAPLLYPSHCADGGVRWPSLGGRKPNAIAVNAETAKLLLPNGHYVLTKRFTSKEERRRVVASIAEPDQVPGQAVAFENHLNVFHSDDGGLAPDFARGLACYLNSTLVDLFFRQFNGHTQVNATDLRKLPYPTKDQLRRLGAAVGAAVLSQEKIDALVAAHVPRLRGEKGLDPLAIHKRVDEARKVLAQLGLPRAQTNERSALTLLALLDLTPDRGWSEAGRPLVGITPMMEFMAEHYGKSYAPNTRETVRRQSIHQFVAAGLCVQNPDDPARPTNSALTVYQVLDEVVTVLRTYGTDEWEPRLAEYREVVQPLAERWAAERDMARIPVVLPNGQEITLSPGGQNVLLKDIVEQFCARFTPGGHVLYIGDSGDKFAVSERQALAALGIAVDEHGKMPDLLVHYADKGWLVVVEAVTSHGPVDAKRREELAELFSDATIPLVYITALPDRAALRRYSPEIAWETDVWVAESPSHLIHFDGDQFLGPYGGGKD